MSNHSNWPRSSTVLKALGVYARAYGNGINSAAIRRGALVDRVCSIIAMGQEDEYDIESYIAEHPEISIYVSEFRGLLANELKGWRFVESQPEYVCEAERYVCHPDFIVARPDRLILELKTGTESDELFRLQTAAQALAGDAHRQLRFVALLPGTGKGRLIEYSDERDVADWLLGVRAWWRFIGHG